jgi:hypothetical protein
MIQNKKTKKKIESKISDMSKTQFQSDKKGVRV